MKRILFVFSCIIITVLSLSACGHDHSFGDWETKTDSTCDAEGEKIRKCECGEIETASIEKKSHNVTETQAIEPGCTTHGYTKGTFCSACGVYIEEPETLEPAHKYSPKVTSAPTCTAKGVNLFTCACGANYSEEIHELGHDYVEATCTKPKTCKKCESTEGVALGHTTILGTCARCNNLVYPAVSLPEFPVYTENNVFLAKTVLKITDITYRFSSKSVTFTFSAEKTEDSGALSNGKYFCGFSYRLYDKDGMLIGSDTYTVNDLAVGDKVNNRVFTVELPGKISDSYVLVIEDYE